MVTDPHPQIRDEHLPPEKYCDFSFLIDAPVDITHGSLEAEIDNYLKTMCLPKADLVSLWKSHPEKYPR